MTCIKWIPVTTPSQHLCACPSGPGIPAEGLWWVRMRLSAYFVKHLHKVLWTCAWVNACTSTAQHLLLAGWHHSVTDTCGFNNSIDTYIWILILQQNRLRWYGHVLRKEDTDWVKKCMEYEVEGSRLRGRPKRTWKEVVHKDCQARNLNKEDAMDRGRWKRLIKIGWWSGWWVGECFFWHRLIWVVPDKGP